MGRADGGAGQRIKRKGSPNLRGGFVVLVYIDDELAPVLLRIVEEMERELRPQVRRKEQSRG